MKYVLAFVFGLIDLVLHYWLAILIYCFYRMASMRYSSGRNI